MKCYHYRFLDTFQGIRIDTKNEERLKNGSWEYTRKSSDKISPQIEALPSVLQFQMASS